MALLGPTATLKHSTIITAWLVLYRLSVLSYLFASDGGPNGPLYGESVVFLGTDGLPQETVNGLHKPGSDTGVDNSGELDRNGDHFHNAPVTATVRNPVSFGKCDSQRDLVITQDSFHYLPIGLPVFHVSVINTGLDCCYSHILVACGDFSSAILVDPTIFRKLSDNVCILNNGGPMSAETMLVFEYASSFSYPLMVTTAVPVD